MESVGQSLDVWIATMELRVAHNFWWTSKGKLQQKWRCGHMYEWREVPHVKVTLELQSR